MLCWYSCVTFDFILFNLFSCSGFQRKVKKMGLTEDVKRVCVTCHFVSEISVNFKEKETEEQMF